MRLFIKLNKLWISPLFLILLVSAWFGGYLELFLIAYCSAMLHELTHVFTARRLKVPVSRIEVLPFGICGRLGVDFIKNPACEFCIAAAGPIMSGILAAAAHFAAAALPQFYAELVYARNINAALAMLNLLPALPLDGGRILKAILAERIGVIRAYNTVLKISRAAVAAIIAASVILLLVCSFNFSLILIGVFLLGSLAAEQKSISMISLKEILYHKNKLKDLGLCRSERLAADSHTAARRFLRSISSHKYYIIDIVGDDGKIIKTVTEGQVLEALINRSIRISFGEI